ncbi:MAG: glycosyltransferase [Thermoplasmatales archaeon]|nr:glycosyltransferase [Candidatus Thermoplasmatota archaeon]MDA8056137.1 glycosyltransferase [Thermoplasmatales archaeon]
MVEEPPVKISVIIASLNDIRIKNALDSLSNQTLKPFEIIVADGGSKWEISKICEEYDAKLENLSGNVVESRNKAISLVKGDLVAFLDTDETAVPTWLEDLARPILNGSADFSGGPMLHHEAKLGPERYVNLVEDFIYEYQVPYNIAYLPLGNSMWRLTLLRQLGGFDQSIPYSEDYDINIRALNAGYKGVFVPDAAIYHDHSEFDSYSKLAKKRYAYLRAAALVFIKNRAISMRMRSRPGGRVKHPFYIVETLLKPIALLDALIRG